MFTEKGKTHSQRNQGREGLNVPAVEIGDQLGSRFLFPFYSPLFNVSVSTLFLF